MKQNGWIRIVVLVALAVGALVLTVISGSKPKQVSGSITLAPFYQKDAFLIAVVRLDSEQRQQDADLARKLIAAKYAPIDESAQSTPFDVVVGVSKAGITVAPGSFFCRDGRYADVNLPMFQTKNPDEAFAFIETIARTQQKICAPVDGSRKNFI